MIDKARLVEMANDWAASGVLDGTTGPVLALLNRHDVVVAVWQDAEEPDGVGMLVVKGDRALRTIIAENKAKNLSIASIPCDCLEQAIALKEVHGEPPAHN